MSTINRVTGLASGMDTEGMIKKLMTAEKIPLDKIKQKKQIAEWKTTDYRTITSQLRAFKDEYMNYLKPESNMLSKTNYNTFTSTITDKITGLASNAVTITTTADTLEADHTVKVERLATAASVTSSEGVTKDIQSTAAITNLALSGKKVRVVLDGIEKTITLADYTSVSNMATDIQDKLTTAFGKGKDDVNGKIQVSETALDSGMIKFTTGNGANVLTILTPEDVTTSGLSGISIADGTKNRISLNTRLSDLAGKFNTPLTFGGTNSDELKFKINDNGEGFTFKSSTTLKDVMTTINNDATSNVYIKYDEVNDKFSIQAKQMGSGENIRISQTEGNFFGGALKINEGSYNNGVDSKAIIDGDTVVRNSNSFSINNVVYNLKAETTNTLDVKMDVDSDKIYDKIKTFVQKYNEFIAKLNDKVDEEYDGDYLPLTDDQRDVMSDTNIETWEKKAKTGLLKNDSIVQKIIRDVRSATLESIKGMSQGLYDIGISTNNYKEKGLLHIDDNKLKESIKKNPDMVANVFSKTSTSQPTYRRTLSQDEMKTRYEEEGIICRISDIIDNNISPLRNSSNFKGALLEKAGIVGDASETSNILYKEIATYKTDITAWLTKLTTKENNYYKKFAAMETAMQKANSQSSWLSGQLSKM